MSVRVMSAALALPLLLALPGCLEVAVQVQFGADGRVTQFVKFAMAADALDRFGGTVVAAPVPGRTSFDPESLFDRESIEDELEQVGGELEAFRASDPGARVREAVVRAGFGGHESFRKSPLFGTRTEWSFRRGVDGVVHVTCYPLGREHWIRSAYEAAQLEHKPDPVRAVVFASQRERLADLEAKFAITVPGRIVQHGRSLQLHGPRTVVAGFDGTKLRSMPQMLRALAPRWDLAFVPDAGCDLDGWQFDEVDVPALERPGEQADEGPESGPRPREAAARR